MVQSDVDQLRRMAGECADALQVARAVLGAATEALVGRGDSDGMNAARSALRELEDRVEALRPAEAAAPLGVRTAVAAAHVSGDMERVADLTRQIADTAWSRPRASEPLPREVRSAMEAVSDGALTDLDQAVEIVRLESVAVADAAALLEGRLLPVRGLQGELDEALILGGRRVGVSDAVDLTLAGRCFEGCAQHAASVARRLVALAS